MSIVIDEDDDLMIVDNNIQTVYTDDKKANYQRKNFLKFLSFHQSGLKMTRTEEIESLQF